MSKKVKSLIEKELITKFSPLEGIAVISPQGMNGTKNNSLRRRLGAKGLKVTVVKNTLARRAAIPVELDIRTDTRPADPIEVAAYYVISEALTNTTRHAHASSTRVTVEQRNALLRLSIRDDGVGGADLKHGSGLIGLRDRVQALGGTIEVSSHPGEGTSIVVELPLQPG